MSLELIAQSTVILSPGLLGLDKFTRCRKSGFPCFLRGLVMAKINTIVLSLTIKFYPLDKILFFLT
ncbi:hypothetical protein CK516_23190 [Nostoc sp. 'Peltigera malacea cyanobiont' DB3992]|nr:hypothetical protein CK516_23190 [Nostoc sp. 'Peltigera malacea cyanobiont' DB3992]